MINLIGGVSVSRETNEKLRRFQALVLKWTPRINLVSKDSIPHLWDRHIVDSAQIFALNLPLGSWLDIGSGGGFPGVVAAIMRADIPMSGPVTLLESDQRKATFLRTALRECDARGVVISQRIEETAPQMAEIITARALAPVSTLLEHANRHLVQNGVAILHKGGNYANEIDAAHQTWEFDATAHQSLTAPESRILEIRNITRAEPR